MAMTSQVLPPSPYFFFFKYLFFYVYLFGCTGSTLLLHTTDLHHHSNKISVVLATIADSQEQPWQPIFVRGDDSYKT